MNDTEFPGCNPGGATTKGFLGLNYQHLRFGSLFGVKIILKGYSNPGKTCLCIFDICMFAIWHENIFRVKGGRYDWYVRNPRVVTTQLKIYQTYS